MVPATPTILFPRRPTTTTNLYGKALPASGIRASSPPTPKPDETRCWRRTAGFGVVTWPTPRDPRATSRSQHRRTLGCDDSTTSRPSSAAPHLRSTVPAATNPGGAPCCTLRPRLSRFPPVAARNATPGSTDTAATPKRGCRCRCRGRWTSPAGSAGSGGPAAGFVTKVRAAGVRLR